MHSKKEDDGDCGRHDAACLRSLTRVQGREGLLDTHAKRVYRLSEEDELISQFPLEKAMSLVSWQGVAAGDPSKITCFLTWSKNGIELWPPPPAGLLTPRNTRGEREPTRDTKRWESGEGLTALDP